MLTIISQSINYLRHLMINQTIGCREIQKRETQMIREHAHSANNYRIELRRSATIN